jgi:hypothetical protein
LKEKIRGIIEDSLLFRVGSDTGDLLVTVINDTALPLGSISPSSDTVEPEGRQMKQC